MHELPRQCLPPADRAVCCMAGVGRGHRYCTCSPAALSWLHQSPPLPQAGSPAAAPMLHSPGANMQHCNSTEHVLWLLMSVADIPLMLLLRQGTDRMHIRVATCKPDNACWRCVSAVLLAWISKASANCTSTALVQLLSFSFRSSESCGCSSAASQPQPVQTAMLLSSKLSAYIFAVCTNEGSNIQVLQLLYVHHTAQGSRRGFEVTVSTIQLTLIDMQGVSMMQGDRGTHDHRCTTMGRRPWCNMRKPYVH